MAQDSFFLKADVSDKIDFELASNLIIIPVEINGVTLSFVLDSGVSKPILFNLEERDSLDLKSTRSFYLHGLGGNGRIKALKSSHNRFKIGNVIGVNKDLYVVFDKSINFTPRLGVLVHGIIGYDIFKDFVVEINYMSKYIRLHRPHTFKPKSSKKWKTIPINIHRKKPYLNAEITINKDKKPVKLLLDTGSSDAIWLFENKREGLMPKKDLFFEDYLGQGLSGSVYGNRSKADKFTIGDFSLSDVNVAFPDSSYVHAARAYKERSGSLGSNILKRFNVFFDYRNKKLHLKKNRFFKEPFTYNNSGIVLEHHGTMFVREQISMSQDNNKKMSSDFSAVKIDFSIEHIMVLKPVYKIVELRTSSNAYASGLKVGDILISINGSPAYDYKLPELNEIFHGKTGKSIKLKIERNGKDMTFKFKLDNAFKKMSAHIERSSLD
ncbi:aspartyl protease family protein [Winogradskyella luteola]|uniref:Aspartyl protease family protein n=1 Tax=Winogradskyella luteola TaxID=2828330 RepID=A0A9X1FC08_9FLAO|nr:aspartyl protease family protein [Winogradskyella luteola]MBV7269975.1 aspartyl protease family protein [Winogradskyella luteola]